MLVGTHLYKQNSSFSWKFNMAARNLFKKYKQNYSFSPWKFKMVAIYNKQSLYN